MTKLRASESNRTASLLVSRVVLVGSALLTGCGLPTVPERNPEAAIQTDRLDYSLVLGETDWTATIIAIYTNTTGQTAFLPRCGTGGPRWVLQRHEDSNWESVFGPACPDIFSVPIAVEPGESRTDTIAIHNPVSTRIVPRIRPDKITGTYRLGYSIRSAEDPLLGQQLPEALRVSNEFRFVRENQ